MPPLANEAEHARYWASQQKPTNRADWLEGYVSALARVQPTMPLQEAYAAAIRAHESQGKIHPYLALASELILGPI